MSSTSLVLTDNVSIFSRVKGRRNVNLKKRLFIAEMLNAWRFLSPTAFPFTTSCRSVMSKFILKSTPEAGLYSRYFDVLTLVFRGQNVYLLHSFSQEAPLNLRGNMICFKDVCNTEWPASMKAIKINVFPVQRSSPSRAQTSLLRGMLGFQPTEQVLCEGIRNVATSTQLW